MVFSQKKHSVFHINFVLNLLLFVGCESTLFRLSVNHFRQSACTNIASPVRDFFRISSCSSESWFFLAIRRMFSRPFQGFSSNLFLQKIQQFCFPADSMCFFYFFLKWSKHNIVSPTYKWNKFWTRTIKFDKNIDLRLTTANIRNKIYFWHIKLHMKWYFYNFSD